MPDKHQEQGWSKWIGLVVLCVAQVGSSGDNMVVSIATSALVKTFNASMSQIQLTNLMFPLVTGALMVVAGMLGLIVGWRNLFRCGVILMVVGEGLASVAPSIVMLNWGARLFVGVGASAMVPALLGLIAGTYQGKDRSIAFGAIGAATGVSCFLAPIVAGWLVDSFNWRVAFIVLAVYFAIVLLGSIWIKKVPRSEHPIRFDFVGSLLIVTGLFFFVMGISKVSVWGLLTPLHPPMLGGQPVTFFGLSPALPLAIVGVITFLVMLKVEKHLEQKHGSVLLPSSFLTTPQVRSGVLMTMLIFLTFGSLIFLLIPYLELVAGFSPIDAGIVLTIMGLPLTVSSLGIPRFFPHISARKVCRIGIMLNTIGALALAFSVHLERVSVLLLFLGLILLGVGSGLLSSQASTVVANAVDHRDAQQSSGIQATSRNIGQVVGIAVLGTIMLFSITGALKQEVNDAPLSQQTVKWVESRPAFNFVSDATFKALAEKETSKAADVNKLVYLNAEARALSTRRSLYALALLTFLFLLGTRSLPGRLKDNYL